jgi:predicted Zn-dependent peptidase
MLEAKVPPLQPVFLDYKKDIQHLKIKNNVHVNYKKNEENNLFNLYYVFEMGTNNNRKLGIAISYLPYLGTRKYSPSQLQEEYYKLGVSFNVFNSEDKVYVSLTGLNENFDKALALFEEVLSDVLPNKEALENMVKDILKSRADAKLNKQVILSTAMANYGKYGKKSAFTNILSEKELKETTAEECIQLIKELDSYDHHIIYYGPAETNKLISSLNTLHRLPAVMKPVPAAIQFEELPSDQDKVYVMHYDMKQAEILMLSKGETFNKENLPLMSLFNEYYGGGMSSIVFQEMRESKALAYSVYSSYTFPNRLVKSHYVMAYIGTQSDKLPEAMESMTHLMNNMPKSELLFEASKEAILQKIQTERITKIAVLFTYERALKLGLDYDYRKDIYTAVPKFTFNDMNAFHEKYIKGKKYTVMVLGDKDKLDMPTLNKYGTVKFLTLEEVFGY